MLFSELLLKRRSIRAYQDKAVDASLLEKVLQAANRAPSAGNLQAYGIAVVRDAARRHELTQLTFGQNWIEQAPVLLVFFADTERNRKTYGDMAEFFALQDATIACAYAELAASAAGLGACWVGAFDDAKVKAIVGAPDSWRTIAFLPIGYAAEAPELRERCPVEQLVKRA